MTKEEEKEKQEKMTTSRFAAFLGRTAGMKSVEVEAVDKAVIAYNTDTADPEKREKVGMLLAIINKIRNM